MHQRNPGALRGPQLQLGVSSPPSGLAAPSPASPVQPGAAFTPASPLHGRAPQQGLSHASPQHAQHAAQPGQHRMDAAEGPDPSPSQQRRDELAEVLVSPRWQELRGCTERMMADCMLAGLELPARAG